MKRAFTVLPVLLLLIVPALGFAAAAAPAKTMVCVGIYSETAAGSISYRIGKANWIVVKVGDKIPMNAEIMVNVDRDWIELIQSDKPLQVYEIDGDPDGKVITKTVADILKMKPRAVAFPKGTKDKPDAKFKDKLVVTQYLGRQIYMTADGDSKDIKYGDVLERTGKVKIIAINNTLDLQNAQGGVTQVVGPLNFDVEKVLTNQQLYKYLNVLR